MPKFCMNYDSGEFEWINEDGFSIDRGEYVYNWDKSDYLREDEEEENRWGGNAWDDDDDNSFGGNAWDDDDDSFGGSAWDNDDDSW